MSIESEVTAHYSRSGLEQAILDALAASGKDIDRLTPEDLSGADEFHFGWRQATIEFAEVLAFPRGARILDIGSGIGGPARHFAEASSVSVTGIDLTEDYVAAANALTRRLGLADRASFRQANALDMPFADRSFDGAYTIHVAMNIADKAKLFAETRRVLKPGARFGIYDIMRGKPGDLSYPMPWATTGATSFVETPATYRALLAAAGFRIDSERDRSGMVLTLVAGMRDKAAKEGPPPLDLHAVMGGASKERIANAGMALSAGLIAPTEMIATAV